MEWFINACAVILLACVTTVMVSLTLAVTALIFSQVKREVGFFKRRSDLSPQELNKLAADQFDAELKKSRQVGGLR
jgi:hypothetical protein